MTDDIFDKSKSQTIATARRDAFVKSIPKDLDEKEDKIKSRLLIDNSSARSKMRKVYNLVDELMSHSKPFTACKKGCSSCCKINVLISEMEAKNIADFKKIPLNPVKSSIRHNIMDFMSIPCPFLVDDACSIYEVRPFVCRSCVSFDETAYWCDPKVNTEIEMPMLKFPNAEAAIHEIGKFKQGSVFADIRDFFK